MHKHERTIPYARPAVRLEVKRAALALSSISQEGEFAGYASLFNVVDMGDDMVMRGAFSASLVRRGAHLVKMLWQHKASEPIGTWLDVHEDALGLYARGKLNLDVARAREAHALLRDGAVDGLSIGFKTERAVRDKKSGVRHLYTLDLWEISVVTFPMLPAARVSAVKCGALETSGTTAAALLLKTKLQKAIVDFT